MRLLNQYYTEKARELLKLGAFKKAAKIADFIMDEVGQGHVSREIALEEKEGKSKTSAIFSIA